MRSKISYRSVLMATAALLFCSNLVFAEVKILSVTPAGRTDGSEASNTIAVTFNQPMVPLEQLPEGNGTGPLSITPAIQGRYRWLGTSTLSFTPTAPFALATAYECVIREHLKSSVTGDELKNDYSWRFETLRPGLLESDPGDNDCWITLDKNIILLFNMPMDPRKVKPDGSGRPAIRIFEIRNKGKKTEIDYIVRNVVKNDKEIRHISMPKKFPNMLLISPTNPLKKGQTYSIAIEWGLLAREGSLGSEHQRTVSFGTYGDFNYLGPVNGEIIPAGYGLTFKFSNPVKMSDLVKNITITPSVEIADDYAALDDSFSAMPQPDMKLKAGTTYQIVINGNLEDKFGQKLGNDTDVTIAIGDYQAHMSMPDGMGIIEKYLPKLRHPANLLNIDHVRLQKMLVPVENIVPLVNGSGALSRTLFTPTTGFTVDREWYPKTNKNERTLLPIELSEVLGSSRNGIVYVQASFDKSLNNYDNCRQALLQVTGLGVTGKFSPDGNLIYVSYLRTALPVIKADIELRDDNNAILWTGKTNDSGFAITPGWEALNIIPREVYKNPRVWVIVKKDGDLSFIHSEWGTGIYPYSFNISYDWRPSCPQYQGYIFSERGIYRPGDPVYLKAIVREKRFGKWQIPRIKDFKVFVKDSRSSEVFRTTVTLSEYGSFDVVYNCDKNAPTGYYTVSAMETSATDKEDSNDNEEYRQQNDRKIRMSSSFRVEEYKPATFEVLTSNDSPQYIIGDTVTVRVEGRYLTGSSMPDAELNYSARLDASWFTPEGCNDYTFGSYDWHESEYSNGDQTIISSSGKLNEKGSFIFSFPVQPNDGQRTYKVVSEASVTAPDRQKLSGRAISVVHGAEFYVGLKSESTFIEKNKAFKTNIIAVNAQGQKIPGRDIACELVRREWQSVRKGGTGGRWEWQTQTSDVVIASFTVRSRTTPVEWSCAPAKSGYYFLKASATDGRGNTIRTSQYFYVTGKDYCAWQRENTDRIELVCDQNKYKPGDTAKILVKSPYEQTRAVVTLEREGIIDQWATTLKGSADTIAIPIKKEYLPNVYVCVMLYQGRTGDNVFSDEEDENGDKQDLGKPSFKIGYTNLPVDPGDKHLSVSVTTDKKEYRPGQEVTVKLKVLDSRNNGTPSEVDVAVCDLGILNLINYATPDPFPYFYGPRPLSVNTADTRLHIIGQRNYGEKGENRGGGGGFMADVDPRSKFMPTAYWNPDIVTDGRGNAEFSFVLPGNLSSFRVMATAHTAISSFGCGDTRFTVNKPLMLKPSLPRFVLAGDSFTAGVLCHNNTQKDGIVAIQVETKGIALDGQNRKEIELKKGEVKEVTFVFKAAKPGNADFVFKGVLGTESDGLQWTVPVQAPRATEAVATYGSAIIDASEAIKIPSKIYDESSSINLSVAPTALVGLTGGLEYLFAYPYGCLEQKTSKVLPLILGGHLIKTYNLAPLKQFTAGQIVDSYLKEAAEFQTSSGGFSFWKENNGIASPYLTCYVLWVLSNAKMQGYVVDLAIMSKAADYLQSYLRGDKTVWAWPYDSNAELTTKAFCVYVLSLNGRHEQAYINTLYAKRDQLALMGKVYLLKAVHYEKMNQMMGDTLIQEINNRAKYSPTEVHFEEPYTDGMRWIWDSSARTTAAILQCLIEVKGEFPNAEKVVKWLVSERRTGRWNNTQDNAYVFYAFNEYARKYEKDNPDFTATVTLEGQKILETAFKGRSISATAPAVKLPVNDYRRDVLLPMTFHKAGPGRLYYDLRMIYAPMGELEERNEGIYVEKKVEAVKGAIDGTTYQLGGRYKVTLKVRSDQDRKFVVVDEPVPAGFEIVNMSLSTESGEEKRQFDQSTASDSSNWWGGFDHTEMYDDRLLLFASYLERGEHTYSYLMQATTAGDYLMLPTKAEEMYTPEVFGRTAQKRITVK